MSAAAAAPPSPPPPQIGEASATIHHTSPSLALVPCRHPLRVRGRGKPPSQRARFLEGTRSATATEMAQAISGVGADEASALGRKVLGVKRVVFPVAAMSVPDRRRLRKRLGSELDAVRDVFSRFFGPGAPPVEDGDGRRAAKRRKVSPFAERAREPRRDDRERLAGRLASMAAALPDHVVTFLQERRVGDAHSRADDGEIEMDDAQSMEDGALLQLKMLLDKFAPESTRPKLLVDKSAFAPVVSTPKSRGGRGASLAASGVSCLSQAPHQEAGGRMPPVQEEEEGVNICGGVARIAIRDIAEEYGELVNDIGVPLLSPLQRKYVDLAEEEDRYVDICGDASPVVFPAKAGDSSSPSLSTSSDSDATSSTDSDSSRSSPEALPKENSHCRAGEPVPAPEADPIQGVHNTQPPMPAPEAIHIAELENQCAAATVIAVTNSPPAPTVLAKECGALAQPPDQAPEAVQIAEPEELKEKRVAPAATVHPISSAPPAAVLPNENGISSQPAPMLAQVEAHIAEPQPLPQRQPQEALIAMARQERKRRAMAKARQELLELERAALPEERVHPRDMELLGIAAFEHVVSTVRDARTAPPEVNDEVDLRFSPGRPSILQQLGVFLKADDSCEEDEEPLPLAVASGGEDMDMEIEDGQIL